MVVDVTSGAEFQAGRPRVLIDQWTFLVGPVRGWDVLPDGSFVTRVVDDDRPEHERVGATEVRIILNLFEELKERIGGGGVWRPLLLAPTGPLWDVGPGLIL